MADFIRQLVVYILGLGLTLFTGILSLYGIGGAISDAMSLRVARFATDNFLPVVGKLLSDSLGTVAGAAALIKGAVGVLGLGFIFLTVGLPLLKMLAAALIYKLAAVLVQILGEERISEALDKASGSLSLISACLAVTGLFFPQRGGVNNIGPHGPGHEGMKMLAELGSLVRQLALIALMASLGEMLLPNQKMAPYVRLMLGGCSSWLPVPQASAGS